MARIKMPSGHESIGVFDGEKQHTYKVKDGELVVSDAHVAAILGAVPRSELKQETPAKEK